jgi:hypothetical protein
METEEGMQARNVLISLALGLAASGAAQAGSVDSMGTVNLRYENTSPAGFATIHRPGSSANETVWTGQYNLSLDPSYTAPSPADATNLLYDAADNYVIGTFCCDVREDAPAGSAYVPYNIVMPEFAPFGSGNTAMGSKADDLRRLYGRYGGIWQDGLGNDDIEAAAFELCVWEIVFETDPTYGVSPGAGAFYATATYTTSWVPTSACDLADSWLAGVKTGVVPNIPLCVLANDGMQDYAIVIPGAGGDDPKPLGHAPEPLTILGLIMGAGGVTCYIRKRRLA